MSMNSAAVSKLYQSLTEEQVRRIMRDVFGPEVAIEQISMLKGGLFNTTYFIETAGPDGKWILRVAPKSHENLYSFEKNMMAVEPYIYELLISHDIPCSRVIRFDDSGDIIPRPYMIIEFIDSIQLNDPSITAEEYIMLQEELGRHTRMMHSITSHKFGWPQPDGSVHGYAAWSQVLIDFAGEVADKCRQHQLFEDSVIDEFISVFHANQELFDEITVPALVHNDLWDPNVLVQRDDQGRPYIVAIIDADRAMFADREFDFIVYKNDPRFMKGYGHVLQTDLRSLTRRKAYKMLMDFFSTFIFAIQIELPRDADWFKQDSLDKLKGVKELLSGWGRQKE